MKQKMIPKTLVGIAAALLMTTPLTAAADSNGTFQWGRDNWSVFNYPLYFDYTYPFRECMTDEHYAALRSNLNHVEYRLTEPMLDWEDFPGACYGFATTSLLACYDILNPDEHYDVYGFTKDQVSLTDDLYSIDYRVFNYPQKSWPRSVVLYYQMTQCTDAARQNSVQICDWTMQQKIDFLYTHGVSNQPVLVTYDWENQSGEGASHAVVACGAETGSWEWNDETYDICIIIYDNVDPTPEIMDDEVKLEHLKRESCLYYNSENGNWIVPSWKITQDNGVLADLVDDVGIVNDKGIFPGTSYTPPEWKDVVTANVLQSDYTVIALDTETELPEYPFFYHDGGEGGEQNFVNRGEEGPYLLQTEQPQELISAAYYENAMLKGTSDAGDEVCFDPAGCVGVAGEKADYELEMVFNEDYVTDWYDIVAKGTSSSVELKMTDEGYLLTADDLHEASLIARNMEDKAIVSVSADAKSVLFRENASGQLVASADLDGDGIYETELAKSRLLGDLNGDDTVNASDAAVLLIAAAEIGAGNASGLTEEQEVAADVDYDRTINASDSANILIYAADVGAGSYAGTLAQYMRSDRS